MDKDHPERKAWNGWERERKRKQRNRDGDEGGKIVTLKDALQGWVQSHGLEKRLGEADVLARWRELVGDAIADQATPVRLERGRLVLQVADSTWRHELLFMRRELIARLNDRIGAGLVREIVLTG